jgi:membrane-associated protease RseP (regulator of RpoE activity)
MSSHNSSEIYVPAEVYPPDTESVVYYSRSKPRYWLHGLLLLLTIFTTLIVGSRLQWEFLNGLPPFFDNDIFPLRWALQGRNLLLGIPFSLTLMLILLSHEMGHYLYCVKYRVAATLPFFIPFPTLFGTLGAFIRIRSPLASRAALFDIGIAGPIAGFAVALPVLIVSLALSHVAPAGAAPPEIQFGYPLVFHLAQKLLSASAHSQAVASAPLSLLYLHPVAIAAWVGMFATSLNLLPGGQLDGGHIVFSISPRSHRTISNTTILALIPMAVYFWAGWLLWAVLLRLSGMRHPAVPLWPEITRSRRWLAVFAAIMLALTFAPAPISRGSLFDLLQQRATSDQRSRLRARFETFLPSKWYGVLGR